MRFVKERVSQNRKKMEKLRDSTQHTRHSGVAGAEGNKGGGDPAASGFGSRRYADWVAGRERRRLIHEAR